MLKPFEELGLEPRHRHNLIKMGLWLWDNRNTISFSMDTFMRDAGGKDYYEIETASREFECGTSCCIIGHSLNPAIGLIPPAKDVELNCWGDLAFKNFGTNNIYNTSDDSGDPGHLDGENADRIWMFLYDGSHSPDITAAVERIFWCLERGCPPAPPHGDAWAQQYMEVHASAAPSCSDRGLMLVLDPNNEWELDIEKWRAELKEESK